MRHSFVKLVLLILLLCCEFENFSQERIRPPKLFGTPDPKWWDKNYYSRDSSASAVILLDYSFNKFGLVKIFSHQRRIKILKKTGFSWCNLEFMINSTTSLNFKGAVYNMVDGHITSTLIDNTSVLTTQVVKGIQQSTVAFPKVMEGSVIEFSYELRGNHLNAPVWNFQMPIPVQWSEYEISFGNHTPSSVVKIGGIYRPIITETKKGSKTYLLNDLPPFIREPLMPDEIYFRSSIDYTFNSVGGYTSANDGKGKEVFLIDKISKESTLRDSVEMDTDVITEANFKWTSPDELTGSLVVRKFGHGRMTAINIIKEVGEKSYSKMLFENKNWTIQNPTISQDSDSTIELVLTADLTVNNQVQNNDSVIYINPFVMLDEEQGPLALDTRQYPLDFGSRIERTSVVSVEIPPGYVVKEVPPDVVMNLPGKSATFLKGAIVRDNKIYVTSTFKTNQILFSPEEYPRLRRYFKQILARGSDMIVLNKK